MADVYALLRSTADELRASLDSAREESAEWLAVADIFYSAADVVANTDRRERGTDVNVLLWKVLTLAKLLGMPAVQSAAASAAPRSGLQEEDRGAEK